MIYLNKKWCCFTKSPNTDIRGKTNYERNCYVRSGEFLKLYPYTKARSPNTSCDGARCYCDITAISTYISDAMIMRSYGSYLRIVAMCEGSNCQLNNINDSDMNIDGLSNTVVPELSGSYHEMIFGLHFRDRKSYPFNKKLMKCVLGHRIHNKSILEAWNRSGSMSCYIFMGIICWP